MAEGLTVVDVGKLSKPINTLIEKVSNATGILYEPTRIRRKAVAEADAAKTKALVDLEIEDIQKRALTRLVNEEIKKQENIESITEKSFENINENSKPEDIEDDWISNFFDKCKLVSDDEMQTLWGKILAGEANNPGTYSKRTIEFMSTMDKYDAELFNNFSQFCWYAGDVKAFIFDYNNDLLKNENIDFDSLKHLTDIGLITFQSNNSFFLTFTSDFFNVAYQGRLLNINLENTNKKITVGNVLLTKIGTDLLKATCPSLKEVWKKNNLYNEKYYHYAVEELYKQGVILAEPITNMFIYKN